MVSQRSSSRFIRTVFAVSAKLTHKYSSWHREMQTFVVHWSRTTPLKRLVHVDNLQYLCWVSEVRCSTNVSLLSWYCWAVRCSSSDPIFFQFFFNFFPIFFQFFFNLLDWDTTHIFNLFSIFWTIWNEHSQSFFNLFSIFLTIWNEHSQSFFNLFSIF